MHSTHHWTRKHMCVIATVARRCAKLPDLSPIQHQTLELVGKLAHSVANGAKECSHDNVQMAVSLLCSACLPGLPGEPPARCPGRHDWQIPCDLIARSVRVECVES